MTLLKLLTNIQEGKPINVDSLLKVLPGNINWRTIFDANDKVAKNRYKVGILDPQAFALLLEQSQPPKTRSEAASHAIHSSHYVGCDSAYMLCYPASNELSLYVPSAHSVAVAQSTTAIQSSLRDRHLLTVASTNNQPLPSLFAPAKHAILIENQDCFFEWQRFMRHFRLSVDCSQCDVFYAGGKRILNSAFAPFLGQYENMYCAFDYDLDGLKIAKSLISKNYANTQILVPDELQSITTLFSFQPRKLETLLEAVSLSKAMGLIQLSEVIASTQHFMEQEALLTLSKPS